MTSAAASSAIRACRLQSDTYTYDDLLTALNQVAPYDWDGFFQRTVESVNPRAPLDGIEGGGWKLIYTDQIPAMQTAREKVMQITDVSYSLGLLLNADASDAAYGKIKDVVMDSPARAAGMSPGMRLLAVDGRKWSPEILREAIRAGKDRPQPIELLIEDGDFFTTYRIDYHQGEQYPQLQRQPDRPDLLAEIIQPRSK